MNRLLMLKDDKLDSEDYEPGSIDSVFIGMYLGVYRSPHRHRLTVLAYAKAVSQDEVIDEDLYSLNVIGVFKDD